MNFFAFPWSIALVVATILFLLFLRELLIFSRLPRHHAERKMSVFNAVLLLLFLGAVAYGTQVLLSHDEQLTSVFPQYPHSRYAPERELLTRASDWVYVTPDNGGDVLGFYLINASTSGYRVTADDASSSGRLLLARGDEQVFLTVVREGNQTVLYFSKEGLLLHVEKPAH